MAEEQQVDQQQNSQGMFPEIVEDNQKRKRKQQGKDEINQAVYAAKRLIIQGHHEAGNKKVYECMTKLIGAKVFRENSLELLPAFFMLAEANIIMGGSRLKKAEEFLIAAYWNLLKTTSDENDKGTGNEEALIDKNDIQRFWSSLHKTFGKLFLAQNRPGAQSQALDELSQGIYLDCVEYGPESIYLCSSYYYMGELFKKEGSVAKAKSFYHKIIQIWKNFILERDLDQQDMTYSIIDDIHYQEAYQHLRTILIFFEMEFGGHEILTGECQFTYALVTLKTGDVEQALENMQKSLVIYSNTLGEFDRKTKEVEETHRMIETMFKHMEQQQ